MRRAVLLGLGLLLTAGGCRQVFGIDPPVRSDADDSCGWKAIATGNGHTCMLGPDDGVYCWGGNWLGQAQPGGPDRGITPTRISLPGPAVQIAAGRENTCARLADGSAWCWGGNTWGQLGNGTTDYTEAVVRVLLDDRIDDIAIGGGHVCARRESDHAVLCWGDNRYNQLGTTATMMSPVPVVVAGTTGATALAVGHRHTCAILNGTLTCWGRNQHAQVGGVPGNPIPSPQIVATQAPVTAIASAGAHNCALDERGAVSCWGQASHGQLGYEFEDSAPAPTTTVLGDVDEVHTGNFSACARKNDGTLWCWGSLSFADGRSGVVHAPEQLALGPISMVDVGSYHVCALVAGEPQCWGSNYADQLGRGVVGQYPTPRPTMMPAGADKVSVGSFFACARAGGQLYCWGTNHFGQLGDGTTFDRMTPTVATTGLPSIDGVATGQQHACAWGGGNVRCWGANFYGQVGNGTVGDRHLTPATVNLGTNAVSAIGAGQDHTCAIAGTGAYCWGANYFGQLGNNSALGDGSPTPVSVIGLGSGTPSQLVVGARHTCAISSGGNLRCWGDNGRGQIGDNSLVHRAAPVLLGVTSPVNVSAGKNHTCAVDSMNDVYCWGANDSGQLGLGDRTDRLVPTRVTMLPGKAIRVAADDRSTCARLMGGAVYCWGWGWGGEIPNGLFGEYMSPVAVPALDPVDAFSRGGGGGCSVDGGVVQCWGQHSMIGDGDDSFFVAMPPTLACPAAN